MKHGYSDHDSSTGSDVETLACLTPAALCCYFSHKALKMLQRHQHHKHSQKVSKRTEVFGLGFIFKTTARLQVLVSSLRWLFISIVIAFLDYIFTVYSYSFTVSITVLRRQLLHRATICHTCWSVIEKGIAPGFSRGWGQSLSEQQADIGEHIVWTWVCTSV